MSRAMEKKLKKVLADGKSTPRSPRYDPEPEQSKPAKSKPEKTKHDDDDHRKSVFQKVEHKIEKLSPKLERGIENVVEKVSPGASRSLVRCRNAWSSVRRPPLTRDRTHGRNARARMGFRVASLLTSGRPSWMRGWMQSRNGRA